MCLGEEQRGDGSVLGKGRIDVSVLGRGKNMMGLSWGEADKVMDLS